MRIVEIHLSFHHHHDITPPIRGLSNSDYKDLHLAINIYMIEVLYGGYGNSHVTPYRYKIVPGVLFRVGPGRWSYTSQTKFKRQGMLEMGLIDVTWITYMSRYIVAMP